MESKDQGGILHKTIQTGYKTHTLGTLLYALTMFTFWGWFGLQVYCTHLYNSTEGEDKILALKTFCVCWVSGFFWNSTLLYPYSVWSLFLRKCVLDEATHVGIFQEMDAADDEGGSRQSFPLPDRIKPAATVLTAIFRGYFTLVFANPNTHPDASKGIYTICPVQHNEDGSRYLIFFFRRYNFQKLSQTFEPGFWKMGKTFKQMCPSVVRMSVVDQAQAALERICADTSTDLDSTDSSNGPTPMGVFTTDGKPLVSAKGLSSSQVQERLGAVGYNVMDVPAPNYVKLLSEEIAKPFYVYQIYIVWIWVCIDYL
jgi:hypothetical protein